MHTADQTRRGFLCHSQHSQANDNLTLADMLEHAMLRLVWLEQKRWSQILAAHGLTVSQFLVLAAIWERQSGCHMGQLADEMLQSSATMTGIVDRLVRMTLVHRQALANDRRVVVVDLTENGRSLLQRVRDEKIERLQQILDRMPGDDQRSMFRLITLYLDMAEPE
jgi:DNA-binding MarR family transcriptional regulator